MRGLLLRAMASGLSIALVLVAGEVVLRLAPAAPRFVNTAVPAPNRPLPPNLPDFRDRPPPGAKTPGSFRVLVTGDSFVWGHGVRARDAYPRRLEERLASLESALELEVVSWSRPGWNTVRVWASLGARLAELEPDLVLLGFTLNDPEPIQQELRERLTAPLHRRQPAAGWSAALHRRSALYRLFWERFENRRQRRAFDGYYSSLFTGQHWRDCLAAMEELRDAARELEIPLLLVVMPVFESQFDASYAYRRLHRKIASAAEELGIPVVDLLSTFRRVDIRRLAVQPFLDPLPNELAHRIAADELTNILVERRLVPASHPPGQQPLPAVRRR